jgi:tetratricopeptide (TPR) repeat protein
VSAEQAKALVASGYEQLPVDKHAAMLLEGDWMAAGERARLLQLQANYLENLTPRGRGAAAFRFGYRWAVRHQDTSAAVQMLSEALAADSQRDAAFHFLREQLGVKEGRWEELVDLAERNAASRTSSPFVIAGGMVISREQLGDEERADALKVRLAAISPTHPLAQGRESDSVEVTVVEDASATEAAPTETLMEIPAVVDASTTASTDEGDAEVVAEEDVEAVDSASSESPADVADSEEVATKDETASLVVEANPLAGSSEASAGEAPASEAVAPIAPAVEPSAAVPVAEPAAEPVAEPVAESAAEPAAEPAVPVAASPSAEPAGVGIAAAPGDSSDVANVAPAAQPADPAKIADYRQKLEKLMAAKRMTEYVKTLVEFADYVTEPEQKVALFLEAADLYTTKFPNAAEAVKCFEAVLAVDGKHAFAIDSLRATYEKRRDWEKLIGLMRREAANMVDGPARVAKSLEIARLATERVKKPEVCIDLWQDVLAGDDGNAEALGALSGLYERSKEWDKLAAVLERQAEFGPDEQVFKKLGQLYGERLNDDSKAIDAWRRLLLLSPGDRAAQEALKKKYLALAMWDDLEVFYAESGKWDEFIRLLEMQEA